MAAERNKWYDQAVEALKKVRAADADLALQLIVREAA